MGMMPESQVLKQHQRIEHLIRKDESDADAAQASVSAKIKSDLTAIH